MKTSTSHKYKKHDFGKDKSEANLLPQGSSKPIDTLNLRIYPLDPFSLNYL